MTESTVMTDTSSALRVLVVDDELLLRWAISETLKQHGHTVIEAADGAAARQALDDSPGGLDAVVLDYRLPDSRDLSLLAHIRQVAPDSALVLITAFGTPELAEGAQQLGAYAVMDKPFEMQDLEATLSKACQSKRH